MARVHTNGNGKATTTNRLPASAILDRQPPFDLKAEISLLGSLILLPELLDDVLLITKADDFYDDAHAKLFRHFQALHEAGKKIDSTLLVDRLKAADEFEAVGGAAYLTKVVNAVPNAAHAIYYAEIVKNKATLRRVIYGCTDILLDAYEPDEQPAELLAKAESTIGRISDAHLGSTETRDFNTLVLASIEALESRAAGGIVSGLATGLMPLDERLGGLKPCESIILAGRPSMGKTAAACRIVRNVCTDGGVVYFASLEMAGIQLADRMLGAEARVNCHRMTSGHLSAEDREHLINAAHRIGAWQLFIDDAPTRSVAEIAAAARRTKRKMGSLSLIVIDYLQLIQPENPRDERVLQIGKISRAVKQLARTLETPVMTLCQVNRASEGNKDHRPRLSNLREAGDIEQDADVVLFVHRPELFGDQKEDEPGQRAEVAEIIIGKQRNGPIGISEYYWFKDVMSFENKAEERFEQQQF